MTKYRQNLPQLGSNIFLTDGGLETTLIFHNKIDLPEFAAFPLLHDESGLAVLRAYYSKYADIARGEGRGFILESATWRASPDWAAKLSISNKSLDAALRKSINLLEEVAREYETENSPMVISGCVGPRGDGYDPKAFMSPEAAEAYHLPQIKVFAETAADMVTAVTMTYVEEAIGVTRAANAVGLPVAISFTVETDGRLPSGQPLGEAIREVDAATNNGPAYYGINCAHPTHYEETISCGEEWVKRIRALRSNASKMSHAELDEAEELDDGNPVELGDQQGQLARALGHIAVIGGCCGTDHRHIEESSRACPV